MSTKQDATVGLGAEVIRDWWQEGETRRAPGQPRVSLVTLTRMGGYRQRLPTGRQRGVTTPNYQTICPAAKS